MRAITHTPTNEIHTMLEPHHLGAVCVPLHRWRADAFHECVVLPLTCRDSNRKLCAPCWRTRPKLMRKRLPCWIKRRSSAGPCGRLYFAKGLGLG